MTTLSTATLTALTEVGSINRAISTNATRIATGKRVAQAADNPSTFAQSAKIGSEIGLNNTLIDGLAATKSALDAADTGLTSAQATLTDLRSKIVAAKTAGTDRAALQVEIAGIQADLQTMAQSAEVSEVNLLYAAADGSYDPVKSFTSGFTRTAGGAITVPTIDVDVRDTALVNDNADDGILDASRTSGATTTTVLGIDISGLGDGDTATMDELIAIVDAALTDITTAQATIGIATDRVDSQSTFLQQLVAVQNAAVSDLTEADLEAAAAENEALLARQQLAIEALAIANSQMSAILRLFD